MTSPTPFAEGAATGAKNAQVQPASAAMPSEEIERTLRAVAAAYPEDVFPEITAEERARLRAQNPDLQDRIAASMGRFLAKHLIAAADEIASFAPILAEKEREKEAAIQVAEMNATAGAFWAERGKAAEARALAAEAALAAERERCAKVAEGHEGLHCGSLLEGPRAQDYDCGQIDASTSIAAAIRAQGE